MNTSPHARLPVMTGGQRECGEKRWKEARCWLHRALTITAVSLQDRPMQRVVRRPVIFKGSPMKMQTISANDICHSPYKTAGQYRDRGIDPDELSSASLAGLVLASRKYDPQRGSFGVYAKFWMKGQIRALFKPARSPAIKKKDRKLSTITGAAPFLSRHRSLRKAKPHGDVATGQSCRLSAPI